MIDELTQIAHAASVSLDRGAHQAIRPPIARRLHGSRRSLIVSVGLLAVVAATVVAIVTLRPQPGEDQAVTPASPITGASFGDVPRLIPGFLPDGFVPESLEMADAQSEFAGVGTLRVYADDSATRERGVAFIVRPVQLTDAAPPRPESLLLSGNVTLSVTPQFTNAIMLTIDSGTAVVYLTGFGVTEAELRAVAGQARWASDGRGVTIDEAALPVGVAERYAVSFAASGALLAKDLDER